MQKFNNDPGGVPVVQSKAKQATTGTGGPNRAGPAASKLQASAGRMLGRGIRFVMKTSSKVTEPADIGARGAELAPYILGLWHGQFMLVPAQKPDGQPIRVMVAKHDDAQLLAQALNTFDMQLIRGAGAGAKGRDRGGAAALRAAIATLDEGINVAMTADVPPGPARRCGLGIVTLARLSGRPVLPLAVASSRYRSLKTWSRMTINLPYSKLGVVLGEPVYVPHDADQETLECCRQTVEDELNKATLRAYALAGANPARATPPRAAGVFNGGAPPPWGFALKAYRAGTTALTPAAPLIISRRIRQGKEDPARRAERMGRPSAPRPEGTLVWLHAASVGETNAILPLMTALKARRADLKFLLTTGTVTSAGLAANRLGPDAIHQYVPLDAPRFVTQFLEHWRPDLAVFTESEIWPNLLLETSARQIPLALVNARMSKQSFRKWRDRSSMALALFARFDLVLAQNRRLADNFGNLGARHTFGVGNLKMDAPPPPVDARALGQLSACLNGRRVFLASCTHVGEDEVVAAAHCGLRAEFADLLTIIVPRHPERGSTIASRLAALGLKVSQRSLGAMPAPGDDIYIADTIGELGTFYSLAPVAFIGGSLVAKGGQNPIEAVKLGCAVLTGPHWQNQKDAYAVLLRKGGACEVDSADTLAQTVKALLSSPERLRAMRDQANDALASLTGALDRTVAALEPLLPAVALNRAETGHAS